MIFGIICFVLGFGLAMLIYERGTLLGWLKAAATWITTQWQKVANKG